MYYKQNMLAVIIDLKNNIGYLKLAKIDKRRHEFILKKGNCTAGVSIEAIILITMMKGLFSKRILKL